MINVDIKPRSGTGVDIYVYDGGNHRQLLHSNQGYENHGDAVDIVERLFASDANARKLAMIRELVEQGWDNDMDLNAIRALLNDETDAPEPVEMTVQWRNGSADLRRIR